MAPATGPLAAVSLWVERLPRTADLNNLNVIADGHPCRMVYIGDPTEDGITQVNVILPERIRTGLVPLAFEPGGASAWIRVIPAGPAVARIVSVTDGINLLSAGRILSRIVKVAMRDVAHPEGFSATVDGIPVTHLDSFCTDPVRQTHEFNFHLPAPIAAGEHHLRIALGSRDFAPLAIEVV